ncbi:hypothetical protein [Vitreimonas flagellata]|uniref:hypothetical protein n=1 Tax=Vitreimonas flagellata TaxID=2560861 RepID=UPI00107579CB|nr:hypothetical protein [Vitreimonas flagellata]
MTEKLNATFYAFHKREKSGVLLRASAAFGVLAIALTCAFFGALYALTGGALFGLTSADPAAANNAITRGNLGGIMLAYMLFLVAMFILIAAYEAACLRWLVRGQEGGGVCGLILGADTWRVYAIYWVWLVVATVLTVLFAVTIAVLSSVWASVPNAPWLAMLTPLLAVIVPLYVSVRLAPAAATAVAKRRFAFFDAWKVSRDRFWPLLGAFALLWLIYVLLVMIVNAMWLGATSVNLVMDVALGGVNDTDELPGAINQAVRDSLSSPTGVATYVAVQVVTWVIAIWLYLALFGVNARVASIALEDGRITPETAST